MTRSEVRYAREHGGPFAVADLYEAKLSDAHRRMTESLASHGMVPGDVHLSGPIPAMVMGELAQMFYLVTRFRHG